MTDEDELLWLFNALVVVGEGFGHPKSLFNLTHIACYVVDHTVAFEYVLVEVAAILILIYLK